MPGIRETRTLPYSAEQMFDLVADVARYPEFLPWVVATRVRSDDGTDDIEIGALGEDDRGLDGVDAAATVERVLGVLAPRERRIVELRFVHGYTQSRIAELVGVSQVQVSRLLRASLATMRESLADVDGSCAV